MTVFKGWEADVVHYKREGLKMERLQKASLLILSVRIRSIHEIIDDLQTLFPVSMRLNLPLQDMGKDFPWESLCDVGTSDTSIWTPDFSTSFEREVSETSVTADHLKDSELQWMTLAERLHFELIYYNQSGNSHLDAKTATICAGSRFGLKNSFVPTVYKNRHGPGVCIGYTGEKDSLGNSGPRQVWRK